jgi:hypothetical protein
MKSGITTHSKAPFRDVIRSRRESWPPDAWDNSVYIGPPSAELDAAWDQLQAGLLFLYSKLS